MSPSVRSAEQEIPCNMLFGGRGMKQITLAIELVSILEEKKFWEGERGSTLISIIVVGNFIEPSEKRLS